MKKIEVTPTQRQEFDRKYLRLRRDVVRGKDIDDAKHALRALFASMAPAQEEGDDEAGED